MAIAYANFTIYSRSRGQSAVAAAAYRAAVRLIDHRTNEAHDYRKREGHIYSEICLPDGADNKFLDREYLWNQVEKSENRRNSQLAKNLLLALPKELDHKQQIHLVKDFSNMYFISKGIPVDISIYDKENGNPFAYIFLTTRRLFGDKFHTHKAKDLDPPFRKGFIIEKEHWSQRWGDFQEEFFKNNNIPITVDEIGIVPQIHEGHIRNKETHYLKEENKLRKQLSKKILEEGCLEEA